MLPTSKGRGKGYKVLLFFNVPNIFITELEGVLKLLANRNLGRREGHMNTVFKNVKCCPTEMFPLCCSEDRAWPTDPLADAEVAHLDSVQRTS